MAWNSSKLLYAKTQQGLKKANQRIATLAKKYGEDSDVFKNEVAFLLKEPAVRYFRNKSGSEPDYFRSGEGPGGGKTKGKKKTRSKAAGNPKFNIKAFNQDIRRGVLSRSEANQILLAAAGMRIEPNGEVNTVGSGITTVTTLKKQARARLESYGEDPGKIMEADIEREIRREAEIKNSFDTEYDDYIAEVGRDTARKRNTKLDQKLFAKRDADGNIIEPRKKLTYSDIQQITKELKEFNKSKRALAKKFEEANKAKEGR